MDGYILEKEMFGIGKWIGYGEGEVGICKGISQISGIGMHACHSTDPRPHEAVRALSFGKAQTGLV